MRALVAAEADRTALGYRSARRWLATLLALIAALAVLPQSSAEAALSPSSPEVKALIAKGVQAIERQQTERLGELALYGLTLLKAEAPKDHPMVKKALEHVRTKRPKLDEPHDDIVYTVGLCLIFLAETDPTGNRAEIQAYLDLMLKLQKPHGGWGYPHIPGGDTSMTQYGVLSMWELARLGVQTPADPWERVSNWLLSTQDPSGAWGYQGKEGPSGLIPQEEVRHSMASAGLGSLYICMDRFGGVRRAGAPTTPALPEGLQQVKKNDNRQFLSTNKVNFGRAAQAMQRGDAWMNLNHKMDPTEYPYYYLYAFERYQSFRELESGQPFSHPNWYDEGVAFLKQTQIPSGGWQRNLGLGVDSAFATLFLLRSSRKSIEKIKHLGAGTMITITGIPLEGNDITVGSGGKVATKPLAGPAESILSAIEDPSNPDYLRAMESLDAKIAASSPKDLDKMADRLRRLAGDDSPDARATALRSLGRTRDMDNVPLLIAGLSDQEPNVFGAAEEGLRFMSRTFTDRGDDELELTPTRRRDVKKHWRDWYLSIRPNAKLEP